MVKCIICNNNFNESEMTTVSPSKYLGESYPETGSFCPECYHKFLLKTKEVYVESEQERTNNLREFTNSPNS